MKRSRFIACIVLIGLSGLQWNKPAKPSPKYVLVLHGGAGTILKKNMSDAAEKKYREALTEALLSGYKLMQNGASGLDAVVAAIKVMEDSPLFNAGKGAVFTNNGKNELDASIMDGATLAAGAVAGVTTIKNPITGARAVMEKSGHVMLSGQGADDFAKAQGLETVDPSYFYTEGRWKALQRLLKKDSAKTELDHDEKKTSFVPTAKSNDEKFGTVGAVALDKKGNLAAGTSTGGMTNKKYGRVGDSPIIGAGTYANQQVAVSCTGWGEFYIRTVAAYDVAAQMEYRKISIEKATQQVIDKIGKLGGNGGMVALDKNGKMAMPFNTEGMFRAAITEEGKVSVWFYRD